MPFSRIEVESLLANCHRRCCICHRFCGVKMETDHIDQSAGGGSDSIDNAIAVCFECHAEIHSYNDNHPRGRKFTSGELHKHKSQWLEICQRNPEALISANYESDVGPLQALIDELEFNAKVAGERDQKDQGCLFQEEQFKRAVREGSISILEESIKTSILDAYVAIGRANQHISSVMIQQPPGNSWATAINRASDSICKAAPKIQAARDRLLEFLSSAE
jgi:hypothetical protein